VLQVVQLLLAQVPLMLAPSVLVVVVMAVVQRTLMAGEDAPMLLETSTEEHRGWRKVVRSSSPKM
jgi:hypothetical protein